MTEAEWLACEEPLSMLEWVRRTVSDRKFRLFTTAAIWPHVSGLQDERIRAGVEVAESAADTLNHDDLKRAIADTGIWSMHRSLAGDPCGHLLSSAISVALGGSRFEASGSFRIARNVVSAVTQLEVALSQGSSPAGSSLLGREQDARVACHRRLAENLRDIVGNPFRSLGLKRQWRTDTAVALAKQMYDSRDFGAMPILADALQEAGCDSEEVLGHCRGPGPHVRGCWLVDLVLGKE